MIGFVLAAGNEEDEENTNRILGMEWLFTDDVIVLGLEKVSDACCEFNNGSINGLVMKRNRKAADLSGR